MIPARKSRAFEAYLAGHAERRLRGTFEGLWAVGLPRLREATAAGPVIVVSNHTSWWDGLVALVLLRRILQVDGYALMDAEGLRSRPFFALAGAFGVDRTDPGDGRRALRWAARRLDGPGRVVWMFPQGEERPIDARPLGFASGAAVLARLCPEAAVVPVGLRYELGGSERPRALVAVGAPVRPAAEPETGRAAPDREAVRAAQEAGVTAALGRIAAAIGAEAPNGFERVLAPRGGGLGRLAERALVGLTRGAAREGPG